MEEDACAKNGNRPERTRFPLAEEGTQTEAPAAQQKRRQPGKRKSLWERLMGGDPRARNESRPERTRLPVTERPRG
jgi:hypothetical protein